MNNKDEIINSISESLLDGHFSLFCGAGVGELKWIDLFSNEIKNYYDNSFSADIYYLAELEKMRANQSESDLYEVIAKKIEEMAASNIYSQEIKNLESIKYGQPTMILRLKIYLMIEKKSPLFIKLIKYSHQN